MTNNDHFALRQAFYRAWGRYHEASGIYWTAILPDRGPVDTRRLVVDVRAAAAVLDTALSALLVSLDTLDPSERDEEERTRMARIQELLQHELALLPADM